MPWFDKKPEPQKEPPPFKPPKTEPPQKPSDGVGINPDDAQIQEPEEDIPDPDRPKK